MSDGMNNPVRYFGRQVRKERLAAGWALAEFGQRTGYDPAHVSRIESGKRPATDVFARLCDQAFPHRNGWFSEFYEESRTWIATPPWFRNYVSHEQRAHTLRNWFPSLLDGLLQTEDYARAILAVSPGVTDDEVSARLAARMKRQAILTRDDPPAAWFLADEAASPPCRLTGGHGRADGAPGGGRTTAEHHHSGGARNRARRPARRVLPDRPCRLRGNRRRRAGIRGR
jgi:hypothetical protein